MKESTAAERGSKQDWPVLVAKGRRACKEERAQQAWREVFGMTLGTDRARHRGWTSGPVNGEARP